MRKIQLILFAALTLGYTSCDYLDVVPKSKATENDIWKTPAEAKKFRFNMMQYMPVLFSYTKSPDQFAGDDFMSGPRSTSYWFPGKSLHYNEENPSQTYFGYWAPVARTNGTNYDLFRGIRYAYYFIDNIHNVKGLDASAASRYEGEAWFMIGYYHQTLLDYYGPTVLIKRFIPFDTDDKNEMFPSRRPVDECVDFIAECYDKAAGLLPESVIEQEWGTPSKATALAYKARLFLWAASPLVNGNPDMVDFKNPDGTQLVSTVSDREKWKRAMDASQEAIIEAEKNYSLYTTNQKPGSDIQTQGKDNYYNAFTEEDWNGQEYLMAKGDKTEIWTLQLCSTPRAVQNDQMSWQATLVPTMEAVEMYYSKNGLPMDVDPLTKDRDLYSVAPGDSTVLLHRDRDPRFYASVGYDRGQFQIESKEITLHARGGELHGWISPTTEYQSCTGYFCQKWVRKSSYYDYEKKTKNAIPYSYPYLRLAELYLSYAEADFEYNGSLSSTSLLYLNKVRTRCGLPKFEDSWAIVGGIPTGDDLRKVLHQERSIEFMFEGRRYHDIRRWKEAEDLLNRQPKAWNVSGKTQDDFYRVVEAEQQAKRQFDKKNYWLAIPQSELNKNKNLVQNPGY